MVVHASDASTFDAEVDLHLSRIAPRPQRLEDTGLGPALLSELIAKHLLDSGVLAIGQLVRKLALSGRIVEQVLQFMRDEARVEVMSAIEADGLRYRLTERGRSSALDAMLRSGYIGPAPVPLQDYAKVVESQTVHGRAITKSAMRRAFEGIVLEEDLLDRIGPSLNSGRAIFVYGPAGTGKTYIAQKLRRLFSDRLLIPHAISVDETIISVFDPIVHRAIRKPHTAQSSLSLETGHDPRYVCCERPVVSAGGELTIEMLEMQHDATSREYRAPLQMKANGGMLLIDDMGRQRAAPEAIFNRWIVPMEERKDYLSLGAGRHFSVPFDVVLIFSTNMHPLELADEAFLRRIGYKIGFDYLTPDQYRHIWQDVCRDRGIVFDAEVLEFVLTELHQKEQVELLPCHPRDLLGIAADLAVYMDEPRRLTKQQLRWAWDNYFVSLKGSDISSPRHGRGNAG